MQKFVSSLLLNLSIAAATAISPATVRADSLEAGFQEPPASARPQTWWHWMNGNITRQGITADLEAMKRVGIGGATIVNVDCGIPRGNVPFMSPEWREDFKFAAQEANRLGLELCVENCAGWSSSGGPWNTPEHAMQRVTTSELNVKGPMHFSGALPLPPQKLEYYRDIAVLAFRADPNSPPPLTIDNIAAKAGFNGDFVMSSPATQKVSPDQVVRRSGILDLTSRLHADGRLDWQVPAGDWTILRFGHTPTGKENHPAPAEGTGPECDKFSKEALNAHWAGFVQKVLDDLGPLAGQGKVLNSVLIDSYEVGGQNWTPQFRSEFKKRRGYDPLYFLPTLTGRVVDSPDISERFLWDIRRTIADLFAQNYYGHFRELCNQHGLKAAVEPYTGPFDSIQCGEQADIPMGEFWVGGQPDASVKLAASVGHIFGRQIIGAESFTAAPGPKHGRWLDDPASLKALGDLVFCQGVNRYIFHRYAMQPWTNRWPGMTMGQWGTHFDRTSTWFEQGRAWLRYVARCQYLLQQGRFVADAAYFCGESAPVELRVGVPALPPGYDYDAVNAGVLLHQASMRDGRLVLPSGASYQVLLLPPSERAMTPELLTKLAGFVAGGLTLVGAPPQASPSLENYPQCDNAVRRLVAEVWANCDGEQVSEHKYDKGRVVRGRPLAQVLGALGVKPDFEFENAADTQLAYIHRRTEAAEIYFVSNQRSHYSTAECRFRVSGLTPDLWDPETGNIRPEPVWRVDQGQTIVPLSLEPAGSVFVVFRSNAQGDHLVRVQHDAARAVAQSPKPVELRILRALYGASPEQSQGSMDVTANVKALLSGGNRRIPASNDMAGDDPAPMIPKELHIDFRLKGQPKTLQIKEGDTADLPAGSQVVKAIYGDLHATTSAHASTLDLTSKLAALVQAGQLNVQIDNSLAGSDPATLLPKELHVDYSLDGVIKHTVVQENEVLTLPETAPSLGAPPTFTFSSRPGASNQLLAWQPGPLRLTWASGRVSTTPCDSVPEPLELKGQWEVDFPPGWGAPQRVTFEQLQSWSASSEAGVKYFSGTATYLKEFEVPEDWVSSKRQLSLDLGVVKNLAEVSLNGEPLGILWKPPFRTDVTGVVKPGKNRLEVKVTNLWPNRLVGDEQLPADCEWNGKQLKGWPNWLLEGKPSPTGRLTFTTWHHWKKEDALLDSGLLGPVTLQVGEVLECR